VKATENQHGTRDEDRLRRQIKGLEQPFSAEKLTVIGRSPGPDLLRTIGVNLFRVPFLISR